MISLMLVPVFETYVWKPHGVGLYDKVTQTVIIGLVPTDEVIIPYL